MCNFSKGKIKGGRGEAGKSLELQGPNVWGLGSFDPFPAELGREGCVSLLVGYVPSLKCQVFALVPVLYQKTQKTCSSW